MICCGERDYLFSGISEKMRRRTIKIHIKETTDVVYVGSGYSGHWRGLQNPAEVWHL